MWPAAPRAGRRRQADDRAVEAAGGRENVPLIDTGLDFTGKYIIGGQAGLCEQEAPMRANVIEVRGDRLYLEVPGQLRFYCPFVTAEDSTKVSKDDTIDITFRLFNRRLVALIHRVV